LDFRGPTSKGEGKRREEKGGREGEERGKEEGRDGGGERRGRVGPPS